MESYYNCTSFVCTFFSGIAFTLYKRQRQWEKYRDLNLPPTCSTIRAGPGGSQGSRTQPVAPLKVEGPAYLSLHHPSLRTRVSRKLDWRQSEAEEPGLKIGTPKWDMGVASLSFITVLHNLLLRYVFISHIYLEEPIMSCKVILGWHKKWSNGKCIWISLHWHSFIVG